MSPQNRSDLGASAPEEWTVAGESHLATVVAEELEREIKDCIFREEKIMREKMEVRGGEGERRELEYKKKMKSRDFGVEL